MNVRIALLQYDPLLKQVERNIQHVNDMIAGLQPGQIDVLLCPEMCFTGYMFASYDDVLPYLEDAAGPSVSWAIETAKRLKAAVFVGYPEKSAPDGQAYNAMACVDAQGNVRTYRKHFLFDTDKTWAREGPSFEAFDLAVPGKGSIRVAPAICMDLNPKDFTAPFDAFEFATFAKAEGVQLVLCGMNWLQSEPPGIAQGDLDDWSSVQYLLSYWATRLSPLIGTKAIFAGCNRIGTECNTTFAGSSCVMRLDARPVVLDYCSPSKEQLLIVSCNI